MTRLWHRILCWLGFHEWRQRSPDIVWNFPPTCRWCGRRKGTKYIDDYGLL